MSYKPNMNKEKAQQFHQKTILAIDYGSKVVGIAKFKVDVDPFPMTLGRIIVKDNSQIIAELKNFIDEEVADVLVVGVPYLLDGKETDQSRKNISFKNLLAEHFSDLEIYTQDETLSTKEAMDRMANSPAFNFKVDMTKIDMVSAVIILEDFLNS